MPGDGLFLTHRAFSHVLVAAVNAVAKYLTEATERKPKLTWLVGLKRVDKSLLIGRHNGSHSLCSKPGDKC